jgi:hypothetical protein
MSSMADQLEVIRLEHRAIRLERALSALRTRTRDYTTTAIPLGLRSAVRDFEREHDEVRQRLAVQRTFNGAATEWRQ